MDLEDIIYIEKKLICGNLNDIDLVYDELDFFQTLNRFAYQNVGLFCLNETYIYITIKELSKNMKMKDINTQENY